MLWVFSILKNWSALFATLSLGEIPLPSRWSVGPDSQVQKYFRLHREELPTGGGEGVLPGALFHAHSRFSYKRRDLLHRSYGVPIVWTSQSIPGGLWWLRVPILLRSRDGGGWNIPRADVFYRLWGAILESFSKLKQLSRIAFGSEIEGAGHQIIFFSSFYPQKWLLSTFLLSDQGIVYKIWQRD